MARKKATKTAAPAAPPGSDRVPTCVTLPARDKEALVRCSNALELYLQRNVSISEVVRMMARILGAWHEAGQLVEELARHGQVPIPPKADPAEISPHVQAHCPRCQWSAVLSRALVESGQCICLPCRSERNALVVVIPGDPAPVEEGDIDLSATAEDWHCPHCNATHTYLSCYTSSRAPRCLHKIGADDVYVEMVPGEGPKCDDSVPRLGRQGARPADAE